MNSASLPESAVIEGLKGHRLGPYMSFCPVSPTQIWQWCSAMGDNNPVYLPGEKQIAPPAMMQMWTMRDINDRYAPGSTDAPPYKVFDDMKLMGYPANVAVSYDISFHRYLRVGERARHFTTVVNISEKKTTGLGVGLFVTERVEYFADDTGLFAEALITYFQYQPPLASPAHNSESAVQDKATGHKPKPTLMGEQAWQPDFENLELSSLSVGDHLPRLAIPITHKLIVGGAIASQDYIPVHHNVPVAQAAGMPDIFMNILTTSGLSARYLSDWAGSGSRLTHIKFNLMAPNFPGDTMVMEGELRAVTPRASGAEVTVEFGGRNQRGYHARGTATMTLPGKESTL